MNSNTPRRDNLIYPELSYKLVGYAYEVYNELGYGHAEKYYQRAYAKMLKDNNHDFVEQKYYPLKFKGEVIGKMFLDFEVDRKIVVELKKTGNYSGKHIDQVMEYLRSSNLKLALLINMASNKVHCKRLINFAAITADDTQIR